MYGKSATHLLRLCGILQNVMFASKICKELPNTGADALVSNSLKLKLTSKKDELVKKLNVIDEKIVKAAKQLLDFYNMNRVILSGYDIQPGGSLDSQISSYLHYERSIPSIDLDPSEIDILQSLLLRPSHIVKLTKFSQAKRFKAEKTKQLVDRLVQLGLGTTRTINSGKSKRKALIFIKIAVNEILNDYAKVKILHRLKMSIDDYKEAYNKTSLEDDSDLDETFSNATSTPQVVRNSLDLNNNINVSHRNIKRNHTEIEDEDVITSTQPPAPNINLEHDLNYSFEFEHSRDSVEENSHTDADDAISTKTRERSHASIIEETELEDNDQEEVFQHKENASFDQVASDSSEDAGKISDKKIDINRSRFHSDASTTKSTGSRRTNEQVQPQSHLVLSDQQQQFLKTLKNQFPNNHLNYLLNSNLLPQTNENELSLFTNILNAYQLVNPFNLHNQHLLMNQAQTHTIQSDHAQILNNHHTSTDQSNILKQIPNSCKDTSKLKELVNLQPLRSSINSPKLTSNVEHNKKIVNSNNARLNEEQRPSKKAKVSNEQTIEEAEYMY